MHATGGNGLFLRVPHVAVAAFSNEVVQLLLLKNGFLQSISTEGSTVPKQFSRLLASFKG